MNVPPMCEYRSPDLKSRLGSEECDLRAEWLILDKTTGKYIQRCAAHLLEVLIPGHTYTICAARSHATRDGKGFTIGEAQRNSICRICGGPGKSKQRVDGTVNTFILGFGFEHAHNDCMDEEARKELEARLSKRGPFSGD